MSTPPIGSTRRSASSSGSASEALSSVQTVQAFTHEGQTRAAFADKMESWSAEQLVWHASGVPALLDALGQRMYEGPIREALQKSSRQALNLAQSLDVVDQVRILESDGQLNRTMTPQQLDAELRKAELARDHLTGDLAQRTGIEVSKL